MNRHNEIDQNEWIWLCFQLEYMNRITNNCYALTRQILFGIEFFYFHFIFIEHTPRESFIRMFVIPFASHLNIGPNRKWHSIFGLVFAKSF